MLGLPHPPVLPTREEGVASGVSRSFVRRWAILLLRPWVMVFRWCWLGWTTEIRSMACLLLPAISSLTVSDATCWTILYMNHYPLPKP